METGVPRLCRCRRVEQSPDFGCADGCKTEQVVRLASRGADEEPLQPQVMQPLEIGEVFVRRTVGGVDGALRRWPPGVFVRDHARCSCVSCKGNRDPRSNPDIGHEKISDHRFFRRVGEELARFARERMLRAEAVGEAAHGALEKLSDIGIRVGRELCLRKSQKALADIRARVRAARDTFSHSERGLRELGCVGRIVFGQRDLPGVEQHPGEGPLRALTFISSESQGLVPMGARHVEVAACERGACQRTLHERTETLVADAARSERGDFFQRGFGFVAPVEAPAA